MKSSKLRVMLRDWSKMKIFGFSILATGCFAGLVIIALTVLSQLDDTAHDPSDAPSGDVKQDSSTRPSTKPFHISSSRKQDDKASSLTPSPAGKTPREKPDLPPEPEELTGTTGEDPLMVSADMLAHMMINIDQYAGQIAAFQHRENGKPAGFRIRHLVEGNDFEKLGIEDGDTIKRVNGLEVNDMKDVLRTVYKLSENTAFRMEVERNGRIKTLNYSLDKNVNILAPFISAMLKVP